MRESLRLLCQGVRLFKDLPSWFEARATVHMLLWGSVEQELDWSRTGLCFGLCSNHLWPWAIKSDESGPICSEWQAYFLAAQLHGTGGSSWFSPQKLGPVYPKVLCSLTTNLHRSGLQNLWICTPLTAYFASAKFFWACNFKLYTHYRINILCSL